MKEPHELRESVTNSAPSHAPVSARKRVKRSTGGSPGQPLSSEIIILCVPTLSCQGEGHTSSQRNQDRELMGDATESQNLRMNGHSPRGNRETSAAPAGHRPAGRSEKASCRTSDMHAAEESDDPIVPGKRTNKTGTPAAESVEERGSPKGIRVSVLLMPDTEPDQVRHRRARRATGRASLETGLIANTQGRSRMR